MTKTALITGISGQDGRCLAAHLNSLGYEVHGTSRSSSAPISGCRATIHQCDLMSTSKMDRIIRSVQPDEIYNLAAQTSVRESWESPGYTVDVNGVSVASLMESVLSQCPSARVFQAGSCEQFAGAADTPQNEQTGFCPTSPFGASKVLATHIIESFRKAYGLFACTGFLYSHESCNSAVDRVARKISKAAAAVKKGGRAGLVISDLHVVREWGYAGDYVRAMHLLLQQEYPRDLVIATGRGATAWDFAVAAFRAADLDESVVRASIAGERGCQRVSALGASLVGDPALAKMTIGWSAEVGMEDLAGKMVLHDLVRGS